MANWIVDGDPGLDLWPFDVRRFGTPHSVKSFMYERAVESYARYYHIAWPAYEPDSGRAGRRSPLHATLANAGAVHGNKFGWERANWFGPPGTRQTTRRSKQPACRPRDCQPGLAALDGPRHRPECR